MTRAKSFIIQFFFFNIKVQGISEMFQLESEVRQGEVLRPLPVWQFLSVEAVDKDTII